MVNLVFFKFCLETDSSFAQASQRLNRSCIITAPQV